MKEAFPFFPFFFCVCNTGGDQRGSAAPARAPTSMGSPRAVPVPWSWREQTEAEGEEAEAEDSLLLLFFSAAAAELRACRIAADCEGP